MVARFSFERGKSCRYSTYTYSKQLGEFLRVGEGGMAHPAPSPKSATAHTSMSVCMHACMYVCMYVCMRFKKTLNLVDVIIVQSSSSNILVFAFVVVVVTVVVFVVVVVLSVVVV